MTSILPNGVLITYPGVQAIEGLRLSDQHGVSAAIVTLTIEPQFGLPDEEGDITIIYNDVTYGFGQQTITMPKCHIDSANYQRNSGGQIVSVRLFDERWAWKDRKITGRYNFRLPNTWLDPGHEKTPRQLATLLFQAIGIQNYDVSDLPNDLRPECNWDHANAARELDGLVNKLGCRIVPIRSTQTWKVCVTGEGQMLPDQYPIKEEGDGIDPKETPDYICVVSAPIRWQLLLPLGPVGRDLNLGYKPLQYLSYAPFAINIDGGFGLGDWETFGDISPTRLPLPDGTCISPQELAQQSVYKTWTLDFSRATVPAQDPATQEYTIRVPKLTKPVYVKQIVVTNELVQSYRDYLGAQHKRPSFIQGSFYGELCESDNYPPGTRIDKQAKIADSGEDETASFSMSLDPEDSRRDIFTVSKPMVQMQSDTTVVAAQLQLAAACLIRDPVTWQPLRYEYYYQIGSGTNKDFCRVERKEDIQPWVIGQYCQVNPSELGIFGYNPAQPTTGLGQTTLLGSSDNFQDVDQQCLYYAQSIAREYTLVTTKQRKYIGIWPIDQNGLIQQVSYELSKGGFFTMASEGTEHSYITPDYLSRRQAVARSGVAEANEYAKYEMRRDDALRGNVNT